MSVEAPYLIYTNQPLSYNGCVQVGKSTEVFYYDCVCDPSMFEEGEEPVEVTVIGSGPDRFSSLAPPHADYILRVKVIRHIDGEDVDIVIPQAQVDSDDVVLEMGIRPHKWYGEP